MTNDNMFNAGNSFQEKFSKSFGDSTTTCNPRKAENGDLIKEIIGNYVTHEFYFAQYAEESIQNGPRMELAIFKEGSKTFLNHIFVGD